MLGSVEFAIEIGKFIPLYVLFDKKFYPGVKAALSKLQIRKPSLSEQIAEAKSNSANRSTSANQRDFANDITRG